MPDRIWLALLATLVTWAVTALGAATVVFFKSPSETRQNVTLGFAAGVMIAASFWSLLSPAVERAAALGQSPALVTTLGFSAGALFLWLCDKAVGTNGDGTALLVLSVTLHNIPEGLAVGVAFGALSDPADREALMGAVSVAVGIALQNFPEGAAVSLPVRRKGASRFRSFLVGQASGIVEPIAGVVGALLVVAVRSLLPFALSFAAGAMMIVSVHELIPACQCDRSRHPYLATMGILSGFTVMTFLDVLLG